MMNESLSKTEIQRLVDGELSTKELEILVGKLTPEARDWSLIGKLFVENQLMDRAIGEQLNEWVPENINGPAVAMNCLVTGNPKSENQPSRLSPASIGWLAVCLSAVLLGGFLLGRSSLSGFGQNNELIQVANHESNSNQTSVIPNSNTDATDVVPNTEGSGANDEHEKIWGQELSNALARSTTPIPIGFRKSLLQSGYLLKEQENVQRVELPGGESINVPVRDVSIQYLGHFALQ